MLFNSYEFLLFVLFILVGHRCLARVGPDSQKALLIAGSLFFYAWWRLDYVVILLGSVAFNYRLGVRIAAAQAAGLATRTQLILGVTCNLALLGYFKYTAFGVSIFNWAAGVSQPLPEIVLPLAISFFTFQQISFLVDASRGGVRSYRLLDYVLFVTFFPQLIAGPIVHHGEMMPQFLRRNKASKRWSNLSVGTTIFAIGLFKKTVIADNVAPMSDRIFQAASQGVPLSFIDTWYGSLAYTVQIYFDFSGYSDMAVGVALLFGIRLPLNFFSPYKASSIIEYWRRWHITLSRFLRDYLYVPLGGNRKGSARRHTNLILTMLIGGLWHGAGWTFAIWGGIHGFYLMVNHAWRYLTNRGSTPRRPSYVEKWLGSALTFLAVVFAFAFFRATEYDAAINMVEGMTGLNGFALPGPGAEERGLISDFSQFHWLAAGLLLAWFAPNTFQIMRRYKPILDPTGVARIGKGESRKNRSIPNLSWRPTLAWLGFGAGTLFVGYVSMARSSFTPFLYFNF